MSTSRAVFSKELGIPFCYTVEHSNGAYLSRTVGEKAENSERIWRQMGRLLCQALLDLNLDKNTKIKRMLTDKLTRKPIIGLDEPSSIQELEEDEPEHDESDCEGED
jgi:hypothetical protein